MLGGFRRWLLVVTVVPALLFGTLYSWLQYRAEREQLRDGVASTARLLGSNIDEYVANHLSAVTMLADTSTSGLTWQADIIRLQKSYPGLGGVVLVDREGHLQLALPEWKYPPRSRGTQIDQEYFAHVRDSGESWASNALHSSGLGKENVVVLAAPLRRNGRFDGVLAGAVDIRSLTAPSVESLRARDYEMLLVDRTGHVIYAGPRLGYGFGQSVAGTPFASAGPALDHAGGKVLLVPGVLGGRDAFFSAEPLHNGWTIYVGAPRALLLHVMLQRILLMTALLLLVVVGVLVASRYQMRRMGAAVDDLLGVLQDYALGREADIERVRSLPEELRPLANAVVMMSGRLNEAYRKLSFSLEKQRELTSQREQEVQARTAELRQAVAELDRMTRVDALTGAYNVRALHERVADPAAMLKTATRASIGVLVLDIDFFKAYNDRYGHPAGDTLLKRVVGLIRSALRSQDDELIRSGGEEFVVLLPGADLEPALIVAQRICDSVRAADIVHDGSVHGRLTVSIGVAVAVPETGLDIKLAMVQADEALYRAKNNGRDRFSV